MRPVFQRSENLLPGLIAGGIAIGSLDRLGIYRLFASALRLSLLDTSHYRLIGNGFYGGLNTPQSIAHRVGLSADDFVAVCLIVDLKKQSMNWVLCWRLWPSPDPGSGRRSQTRHNDLRPSS